jgi:TRAP-type C4-dicarboxylate transport system substrate-binding protein
VPSGKVGSRVIWELYGRYLKQEYPGVKLLTLWTHDPGHLHMAKKPVRKLDDLKGVRLRSPGPMQMQVIKELGGSPLTLPVPELYDSLQRGMVDGTVIGFSAVKDFKLYEVLKYHTLANLYVMPMGMAINPKTWDSLPPDVQKIIEDLTGARMAETAGASFDQYDLIGQDFAKKAGAEFITLSPEEQKKWFDRIKPLNDKWVADMEAKGLPGKKIFEEASQLVQKYSK